MANKQALALEIENLKSQLREREREKNYEVVGSDSEF